MADVKVNGNTYNGITRIKLAKVGGGFEEYKEGAALLDTLVEGGTVGDIESDATSATVSWMQGIQFGNVSFPNATTAIGGINSCYMENLLLPNVTTYRNDAGKGSNSYRMTNGIQNCKIPGTLDLSACDTSVNNVLSFTGSNIGTLKLGKYGPGANIWQGTTITNLVWSGITASDTSNTWFEYFGRATITNLYVPEAVKEDFQKKIDDGTLTKITNLYSIDEWSE